MFLLYDVVHDDESSGFSFGAACGQRGLLKSELEAPSMVGGCTLARHPNNFSVSVPGAERRRRFVGLDIKLGAGQIP